MWLGELVLESRNLWPLAASAGAVLAVAILWLYPSQVRSTGVAGWTAVLLRLLAAGALCAALVRPVILRPKTAEQRGALVVLLDRSRSMGVVDGGRTPAERVALAAALGRLEPGVRPDFGSSILADLERIELLVQEVLAAQNDLDYARLTGRGVAEKQAKLSELAARVGVATREVSARGEGASESADLRQRLKDLENVPDAGAHEEWSNEVRGRLDAARRAARAYQTSADEALYKSNAKVRETCDALAGRSRLELAEDALLDPKSGLIARLGDRTPVIGLTIDAGLNPIQLTRNGAPVSPPELSAVANRSDLTGAVTEAVNGLSGRPVRAVVLLSDGRQVGGRGDITSSVRPSGIPVYTIGVAAEQTPDVSIVEASLPSRSAYAGEALDASVLVRGDGGIKLPGEVRVTTPSGESVERLSPEPQAGRHAAGRELAARFNVPINPRNDPRSAERITFSVPPSPGEVTAENNTVERWVKVSSEKLKVAVCTAAPGWDFQYLRGVLSRRPWVRLESQVLDPAGPRLGLGPAQLLEQDVVVLDDLPVDALDVNQWDALNTLVRYRGGSLILVAGTVYPVADFAHQPIARTFLPFRDVRPAWKEWPGEQPAFHFAPTPLGEQEALRLGEGPDSGLRRWQELPGLYRYLQIPEQNIPAGVARLLLESSSSSPVLLEQRLGAGRVLFVGLSDTWRWRLKNGERDTDQFWRQIVRYAAGEPFGSVQGPLALDVDKVAAEPGEPVHVRARVRGAKFPPAESRSCTVEIVRDGNRVATHALAATGGGQFAADLRDLPEGDVSIELHGQSADGSPVAVRMPVHVAPSDEAEMRNVSGDPANLARIARASGGQYLPIEQADRLAERLESLRESESQFVRRPLWNSPYLFAFVLACLSGEWALRKRFGLA